MQAIPPKNTSSKKQAQQSYSASIYRKATNNELGQKMPEQLQELEEQNLQQPHSSLRWSKL